jgi:hypothetical protein
MMTRSTSSISRTTLFVVFAVALSALGDDCDSSIIQDPTFRDWCGASLCSWALDAGQIARVPTWNEHDYGVSFLTPGTEISQQTSESDARCLLFTTVADIDPASQMTLLVDFNNDGTNDFEGPLGATDWHQVQVEITAPEYYSGITYRLRKEGAGAAVLAEINVTSTTGCTGPVSSVPLLLGENCTAKQPCGEGLFCTEAGLCGACDNSTPCANGGTCASPAFGAFQCNPQQHLGGPGDPCIVGDDCASGTCDGANLSHYGADPNPNCPSSPPGCLLGPQDDGPHISCECLVIHGGTCH